MTMKNKTMIYLFLTYLSLASVFAGESGSLRVFAPPLLQSNSIIQSDCNFSLSGITTKPFSDKNGEKFVIVLAEWLDPYAIKVPVKDNSFVLGIKGHSAGFKNYNLSIYDEVNNLSYRDLQFGDVYIFLGQSNADHPMGGWNGAPVTNSDWNIKHSDIYKNQVRYVRLNRQYSDKPKSHFINSEFSWKKLDRSTAPSLSAIAFFFIKYLTCEDNFKKRPIGIIDASMGGTKLASWLPAKVFNEKQLKDLASFDEKVSDPVLRPFLYFNGMISPLRGTKVKAFILYQGESDINFPTGRYLYQLKSYVQFYREFFES